MNNIEILELFIKSIRSDLHDDSEDNQETADAIENLIQENKELKEENNKLKTCDGILDVFSLGKESSRQRIEFDYIPKSKIEKALDKMNERYMTPEAISNSNGATFNYWTGKRDMCIELLEEGE
jgi:hypothetical protein